MEMFNPPHPGEIIREDCMAPLGLSLTDAAKGLGVNRVSLSAILNGHAGVSANMALRLEAAGWSSAEGWVRMQAAYDLWQARRKATSIQRKIKPFAMPEPA